MLNIHFIICERGKRTEVYDSDSLSYEVYNINKNIFWPRNGKLS